MVVAWTRALAVSLGRSSLNELSWAEINWTFSEEERGRWQAWAIGGWWYHSRNTGVWKRGSIWGHPDPSMHVGPLCRWTYLVAVDMGSRARTRGDSTFCIVHILKLFIPSNLLMGTVTLSSPPPCWSLVRLNPPSLPAARMVFLNRDQNISGTTPAHRLTSCGTWHRMNFNNFLLIKWLKSFFSFCLNDLLPMINSCFIVQVWPTFS